MWKPITCACRDGQLNTGRTGRYVSRNRRTNGNTCHMVAALLTLAGLSSDQTAEAANLRSYRASRKDNSHTHTQQNTRSLEGPSFNCPSDHSGYYPTTDCKSYYWCSNGLPSSSILYSCADGLLFDVEKGRCDWEQSVHCSSLIVLSLEEQQWASAQVDYEAISNGQASLRLTHNPTRSPVNAPTRVPVPYDPDNIKVELAGQEVTGQYGEAMYFPDFAHHCCRGEKEGDDVFKPTWMTKEHMFRNKERCCTELFDWVDLQECLGQGFVELNFFGEAPKIVKVDDDTNKLVTTPAPTPTPSPSKKPTVQPTAQPSSKPTEAATTASPNQQQGSSSILDADARPVVGQSSSTQTAGATTTSTEPYVALVGILHPTPQPTLPPTKYPTSRPTNQPTKQPTSEPTPSPPPTSLSPTVSSQPTREGGIAVEALADATISQNDANKNYGSHPMLLVDGGMAGVQQKYDTLVKFDLSFLESGVSFGKVFLRLFVKDAGGDFCGRFETTQNAYWNEDSVTWMNAPTTTAGVNIGEAWNAVSGEWFELDVTGALKWVLMHDKQKLLSIRISSTEPRRCIFASTSDPGHIPHLFARFLKQDTGSTGAVAAGPLPPAQVSLYRQHGEALMLLPSDDATITKEEPDLVSGKEATLVVKDDGTSTQDILLKFDITEMRKTTPRSGVLMLHLPQSCMSAGVFVSTSRHGNGWTEDTVSWSTAPTFQYGGNGLGNEIGTFGELEGGKYVSFDVIRALSWDIVNYQQNLTIRISSSNGHRCEYTSKEGGQPPKLVIEF